MGIFDFLKDAGDTRGADTGDTELRELQTGNTIIRKMKGLGFEVDDVDVTFDDGRVELRGYVPDRATREKLILVAGNTPGVDTVQESLEVRTDDGAGGRFYTVQKGDTLSGIAEEELDDAAEWERIFEANQPMIENPDLIYPGQVLRIPE